MKPPKGWKWVKAGDVIREGDKYTRTGQHPKIVGYGKYAHDIGEEVHINEYFIRRIKYRKTALKIPSGWKQLSAGSIRHEYDKYYDESDKKFYDTTCCGDKIIKGEIIIRRKPTKRKTK